MKALLPLILSFTALSALPATAAVITFDDIPGAAVTVAVPDGYKGYDWQAYDYFSDSYFGLSVTQDPGLTISAPYLVEGYGFAMNHSTGGLFNVHSVDLANAQCSWTANVPNPQCMGGIPVIAEGYLAGSLVSTVNFVFGADQGPLTLDINMSGIDFFRIYNDSGDFVFMDNVNASTVPVPAAAWLLGSALLGLVGLGRKRR